MRQKKPDFNHIMVIIEHPHGTIETSLTEWMRVGPGRRMLLRPKAAYDLQTGRALPLSIIPFHYRNTSLSRWLVRLKLLPMPWPKTLD